MNFIPWMLPGDLIQHPRHNVCLVLRIWDAGVSRHFCVLVLKDDLEQEAYGVNEDSNHSTWRILIRPSPT
jgi:hypothetical protein